MSPFDSSASASAVPSSASDADLCLALEMIRRDRSIVSEGILIEEASDVSQVGQYEVHYESTSHVRMYIDPRERRTVDFFERAFAWGGEDKVKGKVYILHTSATFDGGVGTAGRQSIVVYASQQQQGAGRGCPVQMVVGRRILKRKPTIGRSSSGSSSSFAMMGEDTGTSMTSSTMHKPDDPMPRVFVQGAREFGRSASAVVASLHSGREPAVAVDKGANGGGGGGGVGGGNHTPGRRGEKRQRQHDEDQDRETTLKKAKDSAAATTDDKSTRSTTTSTTTKDKPHLPTSCSSSRTSVETSNRGTLKRLITHQLLGQGYTKKDDEFNVCFQATYSGSCTALRRVIREKHVDRMDMARIVSEHLDLYVRRVVV